MQSPAGALERLAAHSAEGFPNLLAARERTAVRLAEMRARVAPVALPDDASIVLFGSWGRGELTAHSDDDWLLLVDGPLRPEHDPVVATLRDLLGAEDRKPGTQEIFGAAASAHVLASRIGLDEDTNRSLTRRMLLLLESVPVAGDDAYERCWVHVLNSYLEDATKRNPPAALPAQRPRALLAHDLRRRRGKATWRTRRSGGCATPSCARGDKVLSPRAAADPALRPPPAIGDAPLPRRAAARTGDRSPRRRSRPTTSGQRRTRTGCLRPLDRDARRRLHTRELAAVRRETADASDAYARVRRTGRELEAGLLALLFETPLVVLVREYGVF